MNKFVFIIAIKPLLNAEMQSHNTFKEKKRNHKHDFIWLPKFYYLKTFDSVFL